MESRVWRCATGGGWVVTDRQRHRRTSGKVGWSKGHARVRRSSAVDLHAQIEDIRNMKDRAPGQRVVQATRGTAALQRKMDTAQEQLNKQQEHVSKAREEHGQTEDGLQEGHAALAGSQLAPSSQFFQGDSSAQFRSILFDMRQKVKIRAASLNHLWNVVNTQQEMNGSPSSTDIPVTHEKNVEKTEDTTVATRSTDPNAVTISINALLLLFTDVHVHACAGGVDSERRFLSRQCCSVRSG